MTKRMTMTIGMIRLNVVECYVDKGSRVLDADRFVAMVLAKPQDPDIAIPGLFSV